MNVLITLKVRSIGARKTAGGADKLKGTSKERKSLKERQNASKTTKRNQQENTSKNNLTERLRG